MYSSLVSAKSAVIFKVQGSIRVSGTQYIMWLPSKTAFNYFYPYHSLSFYVEITEAKGWKLKVRQSITRYSWKIIIYYAWGHSRDSEGETCYKLRRWLFILQKKTQNLATQNFSAKQKKNNDFYDTSPIYFL